MTDRVDQVKLSGPVEYKRVADLHKPQGAPDFLAPTIATRTREGDILLNGVSIVILGGHF
jgi:hypothetical protein